MKIPDNTNNRWKWKFRAVLVVFIFLLYGNSLKNKYSLDDEIVTSTYGFQNKRIEQGIKGIPELFSSHYYQSAQQSFDYRPLVLTTFAVEYEIFKKNPFVSHLINLLIYTATCLLLFSILGLLFSGYSILLALAISLIFAAHPIHTEVVCSLKNRDELMAFFFALCSLRFSMSFIDKSKWLSLLLSALFLWLGLLSKTTDIVFVLITPVTLFFYNKNNLTRIILPAIVASSSLLLLYLSKKLLLREDLVERVFVFTENPLYYEPSLFKKIPFVLYILWHYLKLMVIPYPLSCYYGFNSIPIAGWNNPAVWLSFAIYTAITVFSIILIRKKNILGYAILLYLIGIFPYSNLVVPVVGIVADRFAYASTMGFSIAAAYIIFSLGRMDLTSSFSHKIIPWKSWLAGCSLLLFFSILTLNRTSDWKDRITLWRKDVSNFGDSHNLHLLIAKYLEKELPRFPDGPGKNFMIQEIRAHYQKIAKIVESGIQDYQQDYMSRNNLGTIYLDYLNNLPAARNYFEQAIHINPGYKEAYYNLAFCYEKMNLSDSAVKYYEKTIQLDNKNSAAYTHIYQQLLKTDNVSKMMEYSKKAIESFPETAEHYINLGNSYMILKDTVSGIKYFEEGLNKEPENDNLRHQIVAFLKAAGYRDKARSLEH